LDMLWAPVFEMRDAEHSARHQDPIEASGCSWGRTGHGYPPLIDDIDRGLDGQIRSVSSHRF